MQQLSEALEPQPTPDHPHPPILESFVRPGALDQAATPRFVAAVEALGTIPVAATDLSPAPGWARGTLARIVTLAARPEYERWKLSPREFEILRLLLDGCSSDDIGTRLSITAKTVQNCHYQIKAKLGVRNDIELTRVALKLGLI